MEKPKAVLFDWDGTLYDSSKLCFEIYRELFQRFGVGEITLAEFRREFSGDYHKYQQKHGLGPDRWKEFDTAWYEVYYKRLLANGAKLFPNSRRTLRQLKKMKTPTGLVTNATRNRMNRELSGLNLVQYFRAIVTIEDADWEFKPSPKLLDIACEELGVDSSLVIYVGDMAEDVKAGKSAGTLTGVVTTGVHTLERLLEEEPDFIFADAGDVLEVL